MTGISGTGTQGTPQPFIPAGLQATQGAVVDSGFGNFSVFQDSTGVAPGVGQYQYLESYPNLPNPINPTNTNTPPGPPSPEEVNYTYNENLNVELNKLVQNGTITQDQANQISYQIYHPGTTSSDPVVNQYAPEVIASAQTDTQTQLNDPSLEPQITPEDTKDFDSFVSSQYDSAFENQLEQMNLPPNIAAQVRYAHYNPDPPSTNPEVQNALQECNTAAMKQVGQECGLPPGTTVNPETKAYNKDIAANYNSNFNNALNSYMADNPGAPKGLIEYLHYNPGATIPDSDLPTGWTQEMLQDAASECNTVATNSTSAQYGLPPGTSPPLYAGQYDNVLYSNYQNLLTQGQTPEAARQAVIQEFGLPSTWMPTKPSAPGTPSVFNTDLQNNGASDLQGEITLLKNWANGLPDSPEKTVLLKFLAILSTALNKLQNLIYSLEAADAASARWESQMQSQVQINEITVQNAEQKALQAQHPKGGFFGFMSKIFGSKIFKFLMLAVSCVMMGPIFAVLDYQFHFVNKICTACFKLITDAMSHIIPGNSAFAKGLRAAVSFVADVAIVACVASFVCGANPMAAMQVFQESGIFQQFCTMCMGGNPEKGAILMASIMGAVGIAALIVCTIVPGAEEGDLMVADMEAEAVEEEIEMMAEEAPEFMENALYQAPEESESLNPLYEAPEDLSTDADSTLGDTESVDTAPTNQGQFWSRVQQFTKWVVDNQSTLNTVFNIFEQVPRLANAIQQGLLEFNAAALAKIQGQFDSEIAGLQQLVQLIKKMIANLLDALSGLGSWINNNNTMINQMYSGMAAVMPSAQQG